MRHQHRAVGVYVHQRARLSTRESKHIDQPLKQSMRTLDNSRFDHAATSLAHAPPIRVRLADLMVVWPSYVKRESSSNSTM